MKTIVNALAAIGIAVIFGFAAYGVFAAVNRASPSQFEPRMAHPMQHDATVCQRGAGEKWKCKPYVRRD